MWVGDVSGRCNGATSGPEEDVKPISKWVDLWGWGKALGVSDTISFWDELGLAGPSPTFLSPYQASNLALTQQTFH